LPLIHRTLNTYVLAKFFVRVPENHNGAGTDARESRREDRIAELVAGIENSKTGADGAGKQRAESHFPT